MADLLIRGASLPEHCGKCQFMADGWCYAVSQRPDDFVTFDRRPDFCPLVGIPDHGRLGDLDEMAIDESEAYMSAQVKLGDDVITKSINEAVHAKMVRLIADTPTIIPASKEGGA